MSAIASYPRTHPRSGLTGPGSAHRRPAPAADVPTLRVTFEIALTGEQLPPRASWLLELVRDLVDRGDGSVALTGFAGQPAAPDPAPAWSPNPTRSDVADPDQPGRADPGEPRDAGADGPRSTGADEPHTLRVLRASRVVLHGGRLIPLTRLEFGLLLFLAEHPGRAFTRLQLLSSVWGYKQAVARTVDVHVRRLRAKVGETIPVVTTVYGVGYALSDDARVRIDQDD